MPKLKSYLICCGLIGGNLIFILATAQNTVEIRYSQPPTIPFNWNNPQFSSRSIADTLSEGFILQVQNEEGTPIFYSKDITTGVCFDGKCRLLSITLYWNITRRYLSFKLPEDEFLSKHDHEPFVESEYQKLNDLLADALLPLGDISFQELIELPEIHKDSVDGISGATSEDVSKMVVQGAAYTTYTLWNLVYGPTENVITHMTEMQLTPELSDLILNSPELSDKLWMLNRIDQSSRLEPKLTSRLLEMISDDDFYLTYNVINALSSVHFRSAALQIGLFSKYEKVSHSVQKMIIDKFMEAPFLEQEVVISSRNMLDQLNGKQLGDILKMYSAHTIYDLETCKTVAKILQNENRFISGQAYKFLELSKTTDKEIIAQIDRYNLEK